MKRQVFPEVPSKIAAVYPRKDESKLLDPAFAGWVGGAAPQSSPIMKSAGKSFRAKDINQSSNLATLSPLSSWCECLC